MKKFVFLIFALIFTLVLIGCNDNPIEDKFYKVSFVIEEEAIKEVNVKENNKVDKPTDPEKENCQFIGWYSDDLLFDFETLITNDIMLTAKFVELTETSIEIVNYDEKLIVGYTMDLDVKTYPLDKEVAVKWSVDNESLATIDQNGVLTALKEGMVKVTVEDISNSKIFNTVAITIYEDNYSNINPNLGGYEIVIMNAESALADINPFLENYKDSDKLYKQDAWKKIEEGYNCKIVVKAYPNEASWGEKRINWIKDKASYNKSECDIAVISSNWIPKLAASNSLINVKDYYEQYGRNQMMIVQKEASTYMNGLYGVSIGLIKHSIIVDSGLYYNVAMMEKYNIKDPATLFNEGKWNYTEFTDWVIESQAKLPEGLYILGGDPYYYLLGLTNASGTKIADNINLCTNVNHQRVKEACRLINNLHKLNCIDHNSNYAEVNGGFMDGITLMTTGRFGNINIPSIWAEDMFSHSSIKYDYTSYGYVPFPYPNDLKKEDSRCGTSGLSIMTYLSGRIYPEGIDFEDIYCAINDLFLLTTSLQNNDPSYDAKEIITKSIFSSITNEPSIEALLYIDYTKAFYDSTNAIYSSISISDLKNLANNVIYNDKNFDEMYQEYGVKFEEEFYNYMNNK